MVAALNEELVKKLENAIQVNGKRIKEIFDEWQVDKYPNFLNTGSMHKSSLEVMKWKYMKKVLHAFTEKKNEKFVISFTGSSVTAGHDSMYNLTTTPNVQRLMQEPLAAAGLEFESRNVALGNNPCIPYDVCVKFFVGLDADVAVWEQNYFCSGAPLEIFIRQAMTIPTQPIVAFSSSSTGKNYMCMV
ncbi:hypothetical protein EON63_03670 [archaeon]|nr:MAG: hypothetical protein EON63_03670 [archaeon]